MARNAEELREILKDCDESLRNLIDPLVDEIAFMEERLEELRKLPFIKVNAKHPAIQQRTEAAKEYKSTIQQYNNCLRTVATALNRSETGSEHPFAAWLRERTKTD